jgi:CubicO group peptidase (beta-lactamase class C family)
MTTPQRVGLADQTFGHQLDWGLGFIVNSNRYGAETVPYGFGASASDASFGHGGSQSSMGFADPAHRLVVAWVVNGRPGEPRHHSRNKTINEAVYRDLGIAAE